MRIGSFCIFLGHFVGCFTESFGISTTLEAKLMAIIHVVSMTLEKGGHSPWIDYDFALMMYFLYNWSCMLGSLAFIG